MQSAQDQRDGLVDIGGLGKGTVLCGVQAIVAVTEWHTPRTHKVATKCAEGLRARSCAVRQKPRPDAVGRDFQVRPTASGRDAESREKGRVAGRAAMSRATKGAADRATATRRSGGGGEVSRPTAA